MTGEGGGGLFQGTPPLSHREEALDYRRLDGRGRSPHKEPDPPSSQTSVQGKMSRRMGLRAFEGTERTWNDNMKFVAEILNAKENGSQKSLGNYFGQNREGGGEVHNPPTFSIRPIHVHGGDDGGDELALDERRVTREVAAQVRSNLIAGLKKPRFQDQAHLWERFKRD